MVIHLFMFLLDDCDLEVGHEETDDNRLHLFFFKFLKIECQSQNT